MQLATCNLKFNRHKKKFEQSRAAIIFAPVLYITYQERLRDMAQ